MRILTITILLAVSQFAYSQTLQINQESGFKLVKVSTFNLIKLVNMNMQTFQNELVSLGYSYNSNANGYSNGIAMPTGTYVIEKNNPKQVTMTFLHSRLDKTIVTNLQSELESFFVKVGSDGESWYGLTFEGNKYTIALHTTKGIDIVVITKTN